MKKTITLTKDVISVRLEVEPWRPGMVKQRFYDTDARRWAEEKYPNIKLGKLLKNCTVRNQESNTEGEWTFEVVKTPQKKAVSVAKKKKKEVNDVESANGATRGEEG